MLARSGFSFLRQQLFCKDGFCIFLILVVRTVHGGSLSAQITYTYVLGSLLSRSIAQEEPSHQCTVICGPVPESFSKSSESSSERNLQNANYQSSNIFLKSFSALVQAASLWGWASFQEGPAKRQGPEPTMPMNCSPDVEANCSSHGEECLKCAFFRGSADGALHLPASRRLRAAAIPPVFVEEAQFYVRS